jgi:hypothetical protein
MLDLARRIAGLVIALLLVAALPLAAARAACVCDHGHQDGHQHGAADAEPHVCTAACTAATCPMHRKAAPKAAARAASHADHASAPAPAPDAGGMRCSCAGDSQALLGQASVAGVLPALVSLDAPVFARATRPALAETPLRLATSPPAPPPRA